MLIAVALVLLYRALAPSRTVVMANVRNWRRICNIVVLAVRHLVRVCCLLVVVGPARI
jgi:hypothetical protein